MRNLFKPRAMLPAVAALAAIPAVWMLTAAPPASSRPALRGTTLAEPEQPRPLYRENRPEEPVKVKTASRDAPSPSSGSQQFAVICEAGCGSARDAVVDLTPRQDPRAAGRASAPRSVGTAPEAVCIGGCYGAAPVVTGIAEAAPEVRVPAGIVKRPPLRRGEDQSTSSTTKRWYDRLGDQGAR